MVTSLSPEVTRLLDRLYNLRGLDSEIIKAIEAEIANSTRIKEQLKKTAELNGTEMETVAYKKRALEEEYAEFNLAFESIHGQKFSVIFDELEIDLDIDGIKAEIRKKFPETQESLETKLGTLNIEINESEAKIKEIDDRKAEIDLKKDEAVRNQTELNRMLDEIFKGSEDISKQSVKSLLKLFRFTEEECDALAKMLLFPEDTLFIYDRIVSQNINGQTVAQVVQGESKQQEVDQNPNPVEFDADYIAEKSEEDPVFINGADEAVETNFDFGFDPKLGNFNTDYLAEKPEEEEPTISDELKTVLTESNLDITKFSLQQLTDLESCEIKKVIKVNEDIMRLLDIDPYVNSGLLIDLDLEFKVNQLLDNGKSYIDIRNCLSILDIDANQMQAYFELFTKNNYDLTKIPLIVYVNSPMNFLTNIKELNKRNYFVDDKQIYNNAADLLGDPTDTIAILYLIEKYKLAITNADGKIDLTIINIDPNQFEERINAYCEAGAEDLIAQNPRNLALDANVVLARIKYCQLNNVPYLTKAEGGKYLSYIFDQTEFESVVGDVSLESYIPKPTDINQLLEDKIAGAKEVIDYITNYSAAIEGMSYQEEDLKRLIDKIESIAITKGNTYYINDISFAKARVIENLRRLDMNTNSILFNYPDNELAAIALFANTNKTEEEYNIVDELLAPQETFGGKGI